MTPTYDPEFIFTPNIVQFEMECFFCPEPITPENDDWAVHIGLPGKVTMIVHPDCFERLAWSMTNYVFKHQGNIEPEGVVN